MVAVSVAPNKLTSAKKTLFGSRRTCCVQENCRDSKAAQQKRWTSGGGLINQSLSGGVVSRVQFKDD